MVGFPLIRGEVVSMTKYEIISLALQAAQVALTIYDVFFN
mgnify:CR=1 FL=1